ncbi:MAG TPA: hypothetical protein VGC30_00225 [Dokdonella sp.]
MTACSLLAGCGFLHRRAERQSNEYKKAVQERPLEVPPDLDTPNTAGALVVPQAGASAPQSADGAGTAPAGAESGAGTAPQTAVAASGASAIGDALHVEDTVDSTWSRVGLALERSGAATIVSRDDAARAYVVETTGQTTAKPGWFKRVVTLGHAGDKVSAKVQLTVRVSADGNGSRVGVEGATDDASRDAAQSLLATLRQRLS